MSGETEWVDEEAGPVVRPYAMTRGRTRTASTAIDLLAVVAATGVQPPSQADLGSQHRRLMGHLPRNQSKPVAELASVLGLPVGVVRVLVGDLRDYGLLQVRPPQASAVTPTESLLREVISGLRAL
ncbi:DUF742 domain-containing protein [Nonomuraea sp. NPDC050556]|uniref:DUF742 domain-containing protein n=1 Tax=Nonomuraea sp. NPDC050556 TaxID=3364369 RepID=UPI0037B18C19